MITSQRKSVKEPGREVLRMVAANFKPGKITYYKVIGHSRVNGPDGTVERSETTEHWVDYDNETQKVVTTGRPGDLGAMLTKDGKTIGIEGRGSRVDVSENRAIKPFSDRLKDEIGNYRAWLKAGARRLGEETINGVATFKIRRETRIEDTGRVDGRARKMVQTMNVRQDNFYPVKMSNKTYLVDAQGKTELDSSETQIVEGIKLIGRATLPPDFFSLEIPPEASYRVNYDYSLEEARHFKDFDLLYLGDSFEDFKFFERFEYEDERNVDWTLDGWPREMVRVRYFRESSGLSILIWPRFDLRTLLAGRYKGAKTTEVDIDGKPALLIEKNWGRATTREFMMELGRSTLQIEAAGQTDLLIRAAKSLKKVN